VYPVNDRESGGARLSQPQRQPSARKLQIGMSAPPAFERAAAGPAALAECLPSVLPFLWRGASAADTLLPPDMPITVSIVEDDRDTREHLLLLLRGETKLRVLGDYPSGEEAVRGIPLQKPEVALVDINLPGMNGIECVARLKLLLPSLQVLMLTTYEDSELIFNSLRAGAGGYLLKKLMPTELIQAIEQVHEGGAPMSMLIARKVVDHFHRIQRPASAVETLSTREHEVLALLAKGFLYKEIGEALGISLGSVRTYLQRIYEKLQVQSRTEATVKFLTRE
jgi:DNA-binding NarL/FixJ family response regulator